MTAQAIANSRDNYLNIVSTNILERFFNWDLRKFFRVTEYDEADYDDLCYRKIRVGRPLRDYVLQDGQAPVEVANFRTLQIYFHIDAANSRCFVGTGRTYLPSRNGSGVIISADGNVLRGWNLSDGWMKVWTNSGWQSPNLKSWRDEPTF